MKQIYHFKSLVFICLAAFSLQAHAQLSGVLKDSTDHSPVSFANMALLKQSDSTFVKGTATDIDGKFTFAGIKSGDYILRASCVGYKSLWKEVHIEGKTKLNDIFISPESLTLGTIEIVERRPLYSMDGDKTMYNVEDDPAIQNGTTNDALQNAPGVSVDIDGNVTLEGANCVEIWLNDEPSKIKSHNLKTFLDNLPANALKRIEVITRPGAKYANAQGCGVINIITNTKIKKNHFVSFGSGVNSFGDISPFVSYVWANEKLSFSAYASANIRNRTTKNETLSTSFIDNDQGGKDTVYTETTTKENKTRGFGGWFSLNLDYKIDSLSEVSVWAGFDPSVSFVSSESERLRSDFDYDPLGRVNRTESYYKSSTADTSLSGWGMLSANYRKKFDNEGHRLDLSLNSNFSPSTKVSNMIRQYAPSSLLFDDLNKQYSNDENSYSMALSARYTKPFSKSRELSCGLNFNLDNDRNLYDVMLFDSTTSVFEIIDSLRSYDKTTNNANLSGYVDWREKFGNFTLDLGVNADAEYSSFIVANDYFPADTTMTFFALRPNVRLSYRTKSMYDLSLRYSYSTSMPSLSNMTTFRDYTEDSYSVGNSELSRSHRHSIDFTASKFFTKAGYVMLSFDSEWNNNTISSITDMIWDDYMGRYVHFSKPYNAGSSVSQRIMLMGNIRLGAFANLNLFGTVNHSVYEIDYTDGNHYTQEGTRIMLNGSLWAKFWKNYSAYTAFSIVFPGKELFSQSGNVYNLNVGLSADLFDRKLSLGLSVSDPFNWNKITSDITSPYYHSHDTYIRSSRFISFNLTLRFGKLELENQQAKSSSGKAQ